MLNAEIKKVFQHERIVTCLPCSSQRPQASDQVAKERYSSFNDGHPLLLLVETPRPEVVIHPVVEDVGDQIDEVHVEQDQDIVDTLPEELDQPHSFVCLVCLGDYFITFKFFI